jgi:hypothetical protein
MLRLHDVGPLLSRQVQLLLEIVQLRLPGLLEDRTQRSRAIGHCSPRSGRTAQPG